MEGNINSQLRGMNIPRNYFNLTERVDGTIKVGKLIPIYSTLMLPNDLFKINNKVVIRQLPTKNPSFSNYKFITRTFVVAIRNLHKDIYRWLSGYKEYSTKTKYEEPLPTWKPSENKVTQPGELWDWLGFPINCIPDDESLPQDFYRLAYNYIWDMYFRNQTIQDSILDDGEPSKSENEYLLNVNWDRDFFTTCLPFQQLGDPVAIPVEGDQIGKATFNTVPYWLQSVNPYVNNPNGTWDKGMSATGAPDGANGSLNYQISINQWYTQGLTGGASSTPRDQVMGVTRHWDKGTDTIIDRQGWSPNKVNIALKEYLDNNYVKINTIGSILVNELRFAIALQRNAEMLAMGGIRDDEVLKMYYGVAPKDETLGKPYYLGSSKTNILTSEILQTSETTESSPLGDIGGHGLGASASEQITYHAKELCILMVVGYIKPDTTYAQGMPKIKSFKSKYDVALPIFQHLAEQPIYKREILCDSTVKMKEDYTSAGDNTENAKKYNGDIFGYRAIYDHFRDSWNRIAGLLHREQFYTDETNIKVVNNLSNWTETRFFSIKDGEKPALNNDFLKCEIDNRNYNFKKDYKYGDQFLISYTQIVHAWRPLSLLGTPAGLI